LHEQMIARYYRSRI